jgi:hypothetical protein
MKRWIFWTFARGSVQYDVLCALILIAIFAIPPEVFNDRPDYMRIPDSGVQRAADRDGSDVYTVKIISEADGRTDEERALAELGSFLGADAPLDVFRSEAVYNSRGRLSAYAFWLK